MAVARGGRLGEQRHRRRFDRPSRYRGAEGPLAPAPHRRQRAWLVLPHRAVVRIGCGVVARDRGAGRRWLADQRAEALRHQCPLRALLHRSRARGAGRARPPARRHHRVRGPGRHAGNGRGAGGAQDGPPGLRHERGHLRGRPGGRRCAARVRWQGLWRCRDGRSRCRPYRHRRTGRRPGPWRPRPRDGLREHPRAIRGPDRILRSGRRLACPGPHRDRGRAPPGAARRVAEGPGTAVRPGGGRGEALCQRGREPGDVRCAAGVRRLRLHAGLRDRALRA